MFFRLAFLCCWSMLLSNAVFAQLDVKFGLRAGANFSGFSAPSEMGDSSQRLEQFKMSTKIAVAASVRFNFTKRIGLATEIAFSQRGYYYRFNSYDAYLKVPTNGTLFKGHQRRIGMNVVNGYIEVPILFLAEAIDDRLLIEFGPSIGFLISSRALGTSKYIDPDYPNQFMEYDLNYSYMKDTVGKVINPTVRTGKIDGTTIPYPTTVGAYYFSNAKNGNFFNVVDLGVNLGVSYYFTQGLRMGVRGYYGLLDATNNKMDVDLDDLDENNNYILRKDRDVNWGLQLFVGLQF